VGAGVSGGITVEEPEGPVRYEVLAAHDVPPLGFHLELVEAAGVREVSISVADGLAPIEGFWEARAWCGDAPCEDVGVVHLERARP
jgi:hypothetical protein